MSTHETEQNIDNQQWTGLHQKLFNSRKSNLRKYQEMVIGKPGWAALLRYELTILLIGSIPGALGLVLRQKFYRPLFKHVGRNVIFGRDLVLRHAHKISIGDNVIIDDGCLLDAKGESNQGISLGDWVTIGRYSTLTCKNGDIRIGSHVNIGSGVKCVIAEQGTLEIGNNIDIGSSCHFSGGSYDYSVNGVIPSARRKISQGIRLHDLAWIGAGVILLDGVTIGTRSIVGAGSVVNKDIPPDTIAFGVPAKVSKERVS